jgi:hypothetical protein
MTPEDPWTQQYEAFGRFWTGQRELAKRQLRQLAARNAQQRAIAATQPTQRAIIATVQAWSEAVEKIVPAAAVPQTAGLSAPRDVVRDGFEFAEQLLKAQREFTERVLAAARPVTEKRT